MTRILLDLLSQGHMNPAPITQVGQELMPDDLGTAVPLTHQGTWTQSLYRQVGHGTQVTQFLPDLPAPEVQDSDTHHIGGPKNQEGDPGPARPLIPGATVLAPTEQAGRQKTQTSQPGPH